MAVDNISSNFVHTIENFVSCCACACLQSAVPVSVVCFLISPVDGQTTDSEQFHIFFDFLTQHISEENVCLTELHLKLTRSGMRQMKCHKHISFVIVNMISGKAPIFRVPSNSILGVCFFV